jgi:16S rRNA (uracil1498-N3)-methyltransferase
MEYYYLNPENIDKSNTVITLNGFIYNHLVKVLRKKKGDNLVLTDGLRNIFYATIVEIDKENIICVYSKTDFNLNEPKLYVILFAAPLRNADRFEFLIEKAVEIGVSEIYPVYTKNTVKKGNFSNTYFNRLERIIISATGQSQRCFKPILHKGIQFQDVIEINKDIENKFFFYEFAETKDNNLRVTNNQYVSMLIGPEGGFTFDETEMLKLNSWKICSLGPRKLRSETAALIGLHDILNNKMKKT